MAEVCDPAPQDRLDVAGVGQERAHDGLPACAAARRPIAGSTNASGCPGSSARRSAISAAARAAKSGSSTSQSGSAPTTTASAGEAVATRERDRQQLHRERPAGAGRRVRTGPRVARSGATSSGPAGTSTRVPARREQPVREHVVGERPIRVHAPRDDLAHRVGDDEVDPLERGDDRLVRRGERPGHRSARRTYAATARARLVDEPPQDGQRALGAGGDRRRRPGRGRRGRRGTRGGPPRLDRRPEPGHAVGELAARRDVDPDQLRAGVDRDARLVQGVDDRGRRRARRRATAAAGRRAARGARAGRSGWRRSAPARTARASSRSRRRRRAGPTRAGARPRGPGRRCPPRPPGRAPAARRSYSAIAIANGSAMPPPSRRGSGAS